MMHSPIQFKNLSLSFPHKNCFEAFNVSLHYGEHIALMGRNGSGKSSLLKMLMGVIQPSEGEIFIPNDVCMADVPQVIDEFSSLSGGQRFNKALSEALSRQPNLLLLDEPTNHLDARNRKSLMRMLKSYQGSLLIASHDVELLRYCVDTFWHIHEGAIHVFRGSYDDYMRELHVARHAAETELTLLKRQKKDMHEALMKEQARSKTSRAQGEKHIKQRKWPTVVSAAKAARSEQTSGQKKQALQDKKEVLLHRMAGLALPEIIVPTFSLNTEGVGDHVLVSISQGAVGYHQSILQNIALSITGRMRLAITGDNGSGKSTLVKAILNDPSVIKTGEWIVPNLSEIGYLDQHYSSLDSQKSALEIIHDQVDWPHAEIRKHLNAFLFRKNEEVNAKVINLSGGEKARLALAQIASRTPRLLILDEITNNIDLETRAHVMEVLSVYPGALIVISHDQDFLDAIGVTDTFTLLARGS
ncbi:MAG: ATP-binding cassette domain-containing protein [Gammaproteobacteria bacterium]|nr:ATP-binding cassette domain-containing protein [Gammaproteobacteria bacterium]